MPDIHTIQTPTGSLTYTLLRKRVKRLSLRVDQSGTVLLTLPLNFPLARAEEWLLEKAEWVTAQQRKQAQRPRPPLLPQLSPQESYALLLAAMERVLPLVEPLGVQRPLLKMRTMRSQWGNCHWAQGYITLNTALHRCPPHLRDYVALHELIHFLHHDHGPGFYAVMDRLMPDWPQRRQQLKDYSAALVP